MDYNNIRFRKLPLGHRHNNPCSRECIQHKLRQELSRRCKHIACCRPVNLQEFCLLPLVAHRSLSKDLSLCRQRTRLQTLHSNIFLLLSSRCWWCSLPTPSMCLLSFQILDRHHTSQCTSLSCDPLLQSGELVHP